MLIPVGTDRPLHRSTLITYVLIGLNCAVFAFQTVYERIEPEHWEQLRQQLWVYGLDFHWWTLWTSAFLHGGWWHLAGNMVFLWVFGTNIEDRFGRLGFLVFYLGAAAVSGGLHAFFSDHPAIGASGAIAGCTGAFLVLFPRTLVHVFSLLLYVGWTRIPAWWFIGFAVLWDLIGVGSRGTGVAHLAHLGGYGFGASVAFLLLGLKILPREPYDLFSMSKQAYRRRQFREAGRQRDRAIQRHWEHAKRSKPAPGRGPAAEGLSDEVADARAEVSRRLGGDDLAGAAAAYRALVDRFAHVSGATTLSRRHQYDLANHLRASGDAQAAAYAYDRFLEAYPKDPEAPKIRLMLGLINSRDLNDPVRAKTLLGQAVEGLTGEERDLARRELEALG